MPAIPPPRTCDHMSCQIHMCVRCITIYDMIICIFRHNAWMHYSTSHHITSHHITSHHITSHHITSHHITSHHITSHHITSHHITSRVRICYHTYATPRKLFLPPAQLVVLSTRNFFPSNDATGNAKS